MFFFQKKKRNRNNGRRNAVNKRAERADVGD